MEGCGTASSAIATIDRYQGNGRHRGLSGHDCGKYVAILHLAVMIDMAFAQEHGTLGPGSLPDS